jgi:hypothetical protein
MKKKRTVSAAVVEKQIDEAFQKVLEENNLALWSREEKLDLLKRMDLSPEEKIVQGMSLAATLGIESPGKHLATLIETQEELDEALKTLRSDGRKIPTVFRRGLKMASNSLPRRGGPGRKELLTPAEATIMCDQISTFNRQKHSLKKCLEMASELSPKLLHGKTVSPRTLHKHWIKRDTYPSKKE